MPGSTNMPTGLDLFSAKREVDLEANLSEVQRIVVGPTYVNVKGEGAAGNGVDNDSAEVTAAYNAASNGAIMKVPAGEYSIDPDTLALLASRRLEGDGQYASVFTLNADTANPALLIDVPAPVGSTRGIYGPMVKGIGINLAAAPSAIGVRVDTDTGWAWLDDVRVEGGTWSYDGLGPNAKLTNCHLVNPSAGFFRVVDSGLELRLTDVVCSLSTGTLPQAFLVTISSGGIKGAIYMTNVQFNNGATIQKGFRAVAGSDISVPIRAFDVVFDNVAGPSWDLENIMDVVVMGGWANSANGGNDPAVKIFGGGRITYMGTLMNGGVGAGSGWATVEFTGGSPDGCSFIGNEPATQYLYRLTGASSGDPTNLKLDDRMPAGVALAHVTNEPARLRAAMSPLWTPPKFAEKLLVRESGTAPPAGVATLVAGVATINHGGITADTRVKPTMWNPDGTPGHLYSNPSENVAGTSFTVRSTGGATDTSSFYWEIYEAF